MTDTRVVHINDRIEGAVYVGRAVPRKKLYHTTFGNPFRIGKDGDRTEVIALYREWLMKVVSTGWFTDELIALRGKPLACWCRRDGEAKTSGNACHADVLVDLLKTHTDDELRALAKGVAA